MADKVTHRSGYLMHDACLQSILQVWKQWFHSPVKQQPSSPIE